jgi:phosphopantothenoylcysteine decarboxylase/phosphopantothenate--cysteine ligase
MGGATNEVHLITGDGVEDWPEMTKTAVAARLMEKIADELAGR